MATARIAADAVRDACVKQIAELKAWRDAVIAEKIAWRMATPVIEGRLWWRRERFMTEAEASVWLDEYPHEYSLATIREQLVGHLDDRISRREKILHTARAATSDIGDKSLTLDDGEIKMLGLGGAS